MLRRQRSSDPRGALCLRNVPKKTTELRREGTPSECPGRHDQCERFAGGEQWVQNRENCMNSDEKQAKNGYSNDFRYTERSCRAVSRSLGRQAFSLSHNSF